MTTASISELPLSAPSARKRALPRMLARLLAMGIALGVALLLAEVAVRLVLPQHPSWLNFYAKSDVPPYGLQHNAMHVITSGKITWAVYTDDKGFRVDKPAGSAVPAAAGSDAPILLNLGDSFVFGFAVNYEQSIAGAIQTGFGQRYHVINAGCPGYGPTQYRQVLERELAGGMAVKAVIVVTYMGNDFHDCITNKNIAINDGILGNDKSWRSAVKRNSHLYRLVSNALHRLHESKVADRPEEAELFQPEQWSSGKLKGALAIFRDEFINMRDLCRARGIPLLVCVIPTDQAVEGAADARSGLPLRQAMGVMNDAGIPCIDVTAKLVEAGKAKTYLGWDEHLNAVGNRITADATVEAWGKMSK